ncbi:MAG: hypothetical protein KC547_14330 [Anaerolineae bacterium]|nr:hypothetical protein [Anaerolineae bacterium]
MNADGLGCGSWLSAVGVLVTVAKGNPEDYPYNSRQALSGCPLISILP